MDFTSIIDTCPPALKAALHRELVELARLLRMGLVTASIAVRRNDELDAYLRRRIGL